MNTETRTGRFQVGSQCTPQLRRTEFGLPKTEQCTTNRRHVHLPCFPPPRVRPPSQGQAHGDHRHLHGEPAHAAGGPEAGRAAGPAARAQPCLADRGAAAGRQPGGHPPFPVDAGGCGRLHRPLRRGGDRPPGARADDARHPAPRHRPDRHRRGRHRGPRPRARHAGADRPFPRARATFPSGSSPSPATLAPSATAWPASRPNCPRAASTSPRPPGPSTISTGGKTTSSTAGRSP